VLRAFTQAFRTPDLRKKILFTVAIIALYRLGTTVPAPGVDYTIVQTCFKQASSAGGVYGLLNLFSGGALLQLSVFALGIMPYITASIIVQLLVVVIPRFEELKKQGQAGQTKLTQYTRYLTIALGILQSTAIVALARSGKLFSQAGLTCDNPLPDMSIFRLSTLVLTMTAGTAVIMWLGELITERGVGNGMSILIFTSIIARSPAQGWAILKTAGPYGGTAIVVMAVLIITFVIFVEQAQRRIPVQYAKRMIGRRMYGGTSTYLPMKVNQAGVIPVIFASSLLYVPYLLTNLFKNQTTGVVGFIQRNLINTTGSPKPGYLIVYVALIFFFTYFYVAITFDTREVSDNMKKYGGFIPGIRPGRPTAEYLDYIQSRLTFPGAIFLAIVAVLPFVVASFFKGISAGGDFLLGGTALLIVVGVGLDTVKQIDSQLMLRNYEGFLR
jgi:preprotein translocase subunit SecY